MRLKYLATVISSALLLTFVFGGATAAQPKERYVTPVDEAKKDASFVAFRERLIAAVKRRDVKSLLGALDPQIKNSFGGDGGINEFKEMWKLDREPQKSDVWAELLTVLTNGGAFDSRNESGDREFHAPYAFTEFPDDLDAFDEQVIFGSNVNLRFAPNIKSSVVARLSYNVVRVDYDRSVKKPGAEYDYEWLKIETLGGKKGYVSADFVRSAIGYRAGFTKTNGAWKMTFFLAGD